MLERNEIFLDPDNHSELQSSLPEYEATVKTKGSKKSQEKLWNDVKEDDLIDCFEGNRLLYDTSWPGYANKAKKNSVLDDIAKKLEIDSKDVIN